MLLRYSPCSDLLRCTIIRLPVRRFVQEARGESPSARSLAHPDAVQRNEPASRRRRSPSPDNATRSPPFDDYENWVEDDHKGTIWKTTKEELIDAYNGAFSFRA